MGVGDLATVCRNGMGDKPIMNAKERCRKCGSNRTWQLRAPTPEFAGFTQYGMQ